jgi:fucokinase
MICTVKANAAMAPYESSAKDPLIHLSEAWRVLRLSMAFPARIPTWDAILLTAASPAQADLFQWQLQWAKKTGIISSGTVVLAIPDPEGHRIGSGAATLCALQGLAKHLETSDFHEACLPLFNPMVGLIGRMRVLLLHTGGDSKRVPWANPIGKAFLPLPFLAGEDPDGPVLTLFNHILAISATAIQAFSNRGEFCSSSS